MSEAQGVALRLAAPAVSAAVLPAWLAGVGGLASLLVLAGIVAASARLLLAVGDAAEGHGGRWPVVVSCGGIACLVAAGALHVPLLVVGCLACAALELLGSHVVPVADVAEPAELREAPVSRAA